MTTHHAISAPQPAFRPAPSEDISPASELEALTLHRIYQELSHLAPTDATLDAGLARAERQLRQLFQAARLSTLLPCAT